MKIDREAFYDAAHALYCIVEADQADNCGITLSGAITEGIKRQPDSALFAGMWEMLEPIQRAWKFSLADVMTAGHVQEVEAQKDFIFYLIMGCLGHGVGLWDDFTSELTDASNLLGIYLESAPTYIEVPYAWHELAYVRFPNEISPA